MKKHFFLFFLSFATVAQVKPSKPSKPSKSTPNKIIYSPKRPLIRYSPGAFFSYEKLVKASSSSGYGLIDDLTYTYSGNRLMRVEDAVSGNHGSGFVNRNAGSDDYEYYPNGALKKDLNEGIANITYDTFHKKPKEITMTDGRWIKHTYEGSGKLIKTEYSTGEYWEFTPNMVYKNGQPYQIAIPEGRAIKENGQWTTEFDYKDHLGNTRASFKAEGDRLVQTAKTDTDPWGVPLGTGQSNPVENRFEYQGKETEKTLGLNRINFGARTYNPTIGRWDSPDLLSHEYYSVSPYTYVLNRPTIAIDPDGKRVFFVGGANNDSDGWNYMSRWSNAFTSSGIQGFSRINVSRGKASDIIFTNNYRHSGFESYSSANHNYIAGLNPSFESRTRPINNEVINDAVQQIRTNLDSGYSYGSVVQAQAALQLANEGTFVDNVILIGSPISTKSDLYKQLTGNKNIGNVIRFDIPGDKLSNPKDILQFVRGGLQNLSNDGPHFNLARPGVSEDKLIQTVTDWLKSQGVN